MTDVATGEPLPVDEEYFGEFLDSLGTVSTGLGNREFIEPDLRILERETVDVFNWLTRILYQTQDQEVIRKSFTRDWCSRVLRLVRQLSSNRRLGNTDEMYVQRALDLVQLVSSFINTLIFDHNISPDARLNRLTGTQGVKLAPITLQKVMESVNNLKGHASAILATQANQRAQRAATNADDVVGPLREDQGKQGEATLESHFDTFADTEFDRRNVARTWAFICIALGIATAGFLVLFGHTVPGLGNPVSGEFVIARILLSTPLFGIGVYLLRDAGHHRDAAMRAQENSVRLKTIRAYSTELPEEVRDKLRYEFGQRVFNDKTVAIDTDVDAKDLTSIISALTALLGVSGAGKKGD